MQKILLVTIFVSVTLFVTAQNIIDSLKQQLSSAKDTNAVIIMNQLAEHFQDKNTDSALHFAQISFELSSTLNYSKGIIVALNNIGWIYYRKGNYQKASQYAFEALKYGEQFSNNYEQGKAYNTVGAVLSDQNKFEQALDYFRHSLVHFEKANDSFGIGRILNNLSFNAYQLKWHDSAIHYGLKALKNNQRLNNPYPLAFTYRTLGDIYNSLGRTSNALTLFYTGAHLAEKIENQYLLISFLTRIGEVHRNKNKTDSALFYYHNAQSLAAKHGFRSIHAEALYGLAKTYSQSRNHSAAYEYISKYTLLNDSLLNAKNIETLSMLQTNYDAEKKESQIQLLKKEQELHEVEILQQRKFTWLIAVGGMVVLIGLCLIMHRYKLEKKSRQKIDEQAVELKRINEQLIESLKFKNNILSILSHDLRSPLSTLMATISLLDMNVLSEEEFKNLRIELNKQIHTINTTLDSVLRWAMSEVKSDLKATVEKINLRALAQKNIELLESTAKLKNVRLKNLVDDSQAFGDMNQVDMIFRNLISNAIKFSFENREIEIWNEREEYNYQKIFIRDYGVGISKNYASNIFNKSARFTTKGTKNEGGTGLGLILCKEFVELNGGSINFLSEEGKGTTFYFTLPLHSKRYV